MQGACYKRTTCRACAGERIKPFLGLGPQPLANAFLAGRDEFAQEAFYPLDVYFCETCSLVQLLDIVDPEILFRRYIYATGVSETMERHNAKYAAAVADFLKLEPADLVVEPASNDGSLLRQFQKLGSRTLGIEPARNLAAIAQASGIETLDWFFNLDAARRVRESYGAAKVVIFNNVLAHVDDTQDFLRGARHLLAENGLVVFEVPYVKDLLDRLGYDTIYHEHLCYFSVMALTKLCESADLHITRIEHVPVHGGSLRVFAGSQPDHCPGLTEWTAGERQYGLHSLERYEKFAAGVEENRRLLLTFLCEQVAAGRTLAGYGAPAKGNTLLNYCGIGPSMIPYTVDRNERKVGLFTPGMHIPVRPVSALLEDSPDDVLILPWNISDEIIRQQDAYRRRGGRFITPVPEPAVH